LAGLALFISSGLVLGFHIFFGLADLLQADEKRTKE